MELLRILCVCLIVCSATCSASLLDFFRWFSPARSRRDTAVNVDTYCQSVFGAGSYLCRENYKTGYDYLCGSLYCYDKRTQKCAFAIAPGDSTACGNGKWCVAQACQKDAGALTTSDTCPLGDTSNQNVAYGKNCSEIASNYPHLCENATINSTWCCDSCNNVNSNTTANFTGPAIAAYDSCKATYGSDSYFCMNNVHYQGVYGDNMCLNMYCYNSNTGNCEAIPADDGVPCGNGQVQPTVTVIWRWDLCL